MTDAAPESPVRRRSAFQTVLLVAVVVGAIYLAARLSVVFTPLLVAFLLTYIFNPVVNRLAKWMPRIAAILVSFALALGVSGLFLVVGIPRLVQEGATLVEEGFIGERLTKDADADKDWDPGDEYEDANGNGRWDAPKFRRFVDWSEHALHRWLGEGDWRQQLAQFREKLRKEPLDLGGVLRSTGKTLLEAALTGLQAALAVLSFLFLVPVYLFFLLRHMTSWGERFPALVPEAYRVRTVRALARIHSANAAFFRGQIAISLLEGSIVFVALWLMGVKLSFLFGAMYAVLSMVPYLGTVTCFSLTSLFVIAEAGGIGGSFYGICGLFLGIQALEGLVLQPLILGRETGLHPMMVILSLLSFGNLFGFFGLLLAVPLASASIILVQEFLLPLLHQGKVADTGIRPAIKA